MGNVKRNEHRPADEERDEDSVARPGFWQVVQSILAAAFGVQTEEARRRDFTRGNPLAYIIGGVVFTVVLIVLLVVVVRIVLSQSGV